MARFASAKFYSPESNEESMKILVAVKRVVDYNVKVLKVEAPAARSAGIKVKSVEELVEKLKNEAKVI